MATNYTPGEQIDMLCRFCKRVYPAQLERSIAENGRTIDKDSTFEYCCSKCMKTFCYYGKDLIEAPKNGNEEESEEKTENRSYSPKDHFLIGETIYHPQFEETGKIVGKDTGATSRIIVQFEKSGIRRLVEDI
ncbi:MAG: hypothetical protein GF350_10700 [Chitinivibrionales bacterium]|nr:hypothetical protein [Chitinivibrionales bacterium]